MTSAISVVPIRTAEDLIAVLRPHDVRWQPYPGEWLFRGLWDSTFELLPSAYRARAWQQFAAPGELPFDPIAGYQSEVVQAQHEYKVLNTFLAGIDRAGLDIPNEVFIREGFKGESGSDLEFVLQPVISTFAALAQHHGIPTRLLDWTRVGIHAAYFAAAEAAAVATKSGSLSVWAVSVAFVEYVEALQNQSDLLQAAPRVSLITAPRASNPNLHAQVGVFIMWWHMAKIAPLDDVVLQILSALETTAQSWTGVSPLVRFDLPWAEAPKLLRLLSYEQVDGARMFPGRDGVVRAIKERGLWDRKE